MKNLLYFFVWVCLLATFSPAQDTKQNFIERVEINLSLYGDPTSEVVGFDDPKSYWKVEYELVLSDSFVLEKLGRCRRTEVYHLLCPINKDKKLDRTIKRSSVPIAKGKFSKKGPLTDTDLSIVQPIELTPEVIDIFNKAVNSSANPTFVLFVKTKAFTKTRDKAKFRKKMSTSGVHPFKQFSADKTLGGYWNIGRFGVSFSISRAENGKLSGFGIYRY